MPTIEVSANDELLARIDEYFQVGGFWNPESMEHDKVRDLLLDCRTRVAANAALAARCVPREPTIAMLVAAQDAGERDMQQATETWEAMYDAALPSPVPSREPGPIDTRDGFGIAGMGKRSQAEGETG